MAESLRITDPNCLPDAAVEPTRLILEEPQSRSDIRHVKLVLLRPLAKADMLATCRNPDSRVIHLPENVEGGPSYVEFLKIGPLSAAWRQAIKDLAPSTRVVFDLSLPTKEVGANRFQRVSWHQNIPRQGGLAVIARDVMAMVITLNEDEGGRSYIV